MFQLDMVLINYDCGSDLLILMKKNLIIFVKMMILLDLQGSHWAPHLIHKEVWDKIGGFSEEFNPGDGSDPDFNMKLMELEGVEFLRVLIILKFIILAL